MNSIDKLRLTVTAGFLMLSAPAIAQDAPDDHADVWSTVEGQWEAEEDGGNDWIDELLTDDFSGWSNNSPAPRSKSSTRMWEKFDDGQRRMVAHELYPLAIVVNGDVAVAHYLYSQALENNNEEVETTSGRYSDILIRTEDGWKFIAWHGGDDD